MQTPSSEAVADRPSLADWERQLGQHLVHRAWLTSDRVQRAFEAQMMGGGSLGTCLLELGLITEDRLLEALSEVYGLPAATTSDLRKVRSNAIAQLPASVAQRSRAAPFRIVGGELWLALTEPGEDAVLAELADISQRKLRPHVTTEARLIEALSSYYALPIPQRFAMLLSRLNRPPALWEETQPKTARVITLSEEERQALQVRPAASSPPPTRATHIASLTPPRRPATAATSTAPGHAELENKLSQAADLDEIGTAVLTAVAPLAERAVLFKIRGDKIQGWIGRGENLDEKALSGFELDFGEPSVFLNLRHGAGIHLGPLPPMPAHLAVARLWKGELPQAALVAPIQVRGRLVAVFFGERGSQGLAGVDLKALKTAMSACAAALELHLMQRKTRKT